MADIIALAERALEIYREGDATSIPSAARKAVIGSGISYEPDVERIASQVCSELGRRAGAVSRRKAQERKKRAEAQQRYEKGLGHKPAQPKPGPKKPKHYEPKQLILL